MKIIIESTTKIVTLSDDRDREHIQARIWEGFTDSGIPVHCYVTGIAVAEGQPTEQFERELKNQRAPSAEVEAIPLRMIL